MEPRPIWVLLGLYDCTQPWQLTPLLLDVSRKPILRRDFVRKSQYGQQNFLDPYLKVINSDGKCLHSLPTHTATVRQMVSDCIETVFVWVDDRP